MMLGSNITLLHVAKAIIKRSSDDTYLILRSSKWEQRPDRSEKPDLPGGMVEEGEQMSEGCAREIYEETGISVDPSELTLVHATTYRSKRDGASVNRLIYFVEVANPEITLSWEHDQYEWLGAEEVAALDIRPHYKEIFTYLREIGLLA